MFRIGRDNKRAGRFRPQEHKGPKWEPRNPEVHRMR